MSEDDGFIVAILNDPYDLSLRLVYADWLEERGDPRAAFLRLEIAGHHTHRLKALSKQLDPSWLGLMNVGLHRGDVVAVIGGLLEGVEATILEVDWKRGVVRVSPHMFCRPIEWPEIKLSEVCRLRKCQTFGSDN